MKKFTKKFSNVKILIVDDYPLNHEILASLLKPAGCILASAYNGREAIDYYTKNDHIDMIIMDVMMPELDGYQTTAEIRRLEKVSKRHTAIVALTANAEDADRKKCLDAGMDDYITKPIKSETVEEMLDRYVKIPEPTVAESPASSGTAAKPLSETKPEEKKEGVINSASESVRKSLFGFIGGSDKK